MMNGNSYDISFTGKQYKIKYLGNPVNFEKPRKCQHVKQNLGLKGLNEPFWVNKAQFN